MGAPPGGRGGGGLLRGAKGPEPQRFPVFTSIILKCHDLHIYFTSKTAVTQTRPPFSIKACPPGRRQINRPLKQINEQMHPRRATRAVIHREEMKPGKQSSGYSTFHSVSVSQFLICEDVLSPVSLVTSPTRRQGGARTQ